MVYLIALIIALGAAYFNDRMTPALRKTVLVLLCLYVILIFGFRYKVGVDTISYMNAYAKIPPVEKIFSTKSATTTRFEPGFLLMCSICKSFTHEFWPVQMLLAAIANGCIFIFLYKYCKNAFIGILLYFSLLVFYFSTETIREGAAVGIFLLNFKNLQNKKWLNYYLLSLLSIMFHYSAAIIWFFPFVKWLKSNIFFYILCIAFLAITPLVERLNELLQIAAISGKIGQYVDSAQDLNLNWRLGELIRSCIPAIVTLLVYSFYKVECEFRHFILLQILFCMGAFAIPVIFSRFTNYTYLFVIVSAANFISLSSHNVSISVKSIFIALIFLCQSYSLYSNYKRWFPYSSIFYPQEYVFRNNIYRHDFMPWLRFTRQ